jgi:hypothetical protein
MSRFLKAMRQRRSVAAELSHRVNAAVAASLKTFGNAAVAASLRLRRGARCTLASGACKERIAPLHGGVPYESFILWAVDAIHCAPT